MQKTLALIAGFALSVVPLSVYAQSPITTYQTYVNTNVIKNGKGAISGDIMNTALNYVLPIFSSMGTWDSNGNFFLAPSSLPAASIGQLGGVVAGSCASHLWVTGVGSGTGTIICAQPSASDVSGLAASATIDTTIAGNISTGILPAARLPAPTTSTFGGVKSAIAIANQFQTGIDTTGTPTFAQPSFANLSSSASCGQLPPLTGDVTTSGCAATLPTVNSNTGSFGGASSVPSLTVNAKGQVTAASATAVIAPAGTLTGTALASNVVSSSLTSFASGAAATNLASSAGSTRGGVYEYGASGITQTGPGTAGNILTSNGPGADPTFQAPGAVASVVGFRNRIVNGGMDLATVRGNASYTVGAGSNTYVLDDWYAVSTGGSFTAQQIISMNTSGTATRATFQATGGAGVTGISFCQRIESANSYDLAGNSATLSVNLSDSLLTSVGWSVSYANSTNNFGGGTTSISSGTFTVSSSSSRYSATVSVPSAATTGIVVCLSVGAQTSGTWNIGAVQFELGSAATSYERIPIQVQALRAARYLYCTYPVGTAVGTASQDSTALEYNVPSTFANSYGGVNWAFPTQMFTIPAITTYNPHTGASGSAYAQNAAASLAAAGVNISTSFAYLGLTNQSTTQGDFIKFHACAEAEIP